MKLIRKPRAAAERGHQPTQSRGGAKPTRQVKKSSTRGVSRGRRPGTRTPKNLTEGLSPIRGKMTRIEFVEHIVETIGEEAINARAVKKVLVAVESAIFASLMPRSGGEFVWAGIFKAVTVKKPATKGGQRKIAPFNGQEYITKPKPATIKVRVRPLVKLRRVALGEV